MLSYRGLHSDCIFYGFVVVRAFLARFLVAVSVDVEMLLVKQKGLGNIVALVMCGVGFFHASNAFERGSFSFWAVLYENTLDNA